jgi:hypothetical protein
MMGALRLHLQFWLIPMKIPAIFRLAMFQQLHFTCLYACVSFRFLVNLVGNSTLLGLSDEQKRLEIF